MIKDSSANIFRFAMSAEIFFQGGSVQADARDVSNALPLIEVFDSSYSLRDAPVSQPMHFTDCTFHLICVEARLASSVMYDSFWTARL
jgi:hypothetical protein